MIQITFHGHSFFQIIKDSSYKDQDDHRDNNHNHYTILVDPFITDNPKCDVMIDDVLTRDSDVLVITHGHRDHIWDSIAILKAHPSCIVVAPYGIVQWLQSQGITNPMQGLGIWWTRSNEQAYFKLVNAIHDGSILNTWLSTQPSWIIITINDKHIYHAGDTALHTDMQLIPSWWPIDVALLPIGDHYTMGVHDAIIATSWIKPTIVVPIHYNTFPTIKADDMEFARQVMLHKYATPKVLKSWQSIVLE